MTHSKKSITTLIVLTLMLGLINAGDAQAVEPLTWTVNTTADPGSGSCGTICTLRDAISDAYIGDTIVFDPLLSGDTIALGSTLTINKDLTIDGTGLSSNINISGGNAVQVFNITGGTVELNRLNIINGSAGIGAGGAGVSNSSVLTISNSTISNNNATESGGGIYNLHILTVVNSTFSGNISGTFGGGIFHTNPTGYLTVINSTFSENIAQKGGGIFTYNTVKVVNSTFSANEADYGGGFYNTGTATILNSTFYGNIANTNGNGLYNDETLHLKNTILYHDHSVDPKQDCYNFSGNTISSEIGNILAPMGPDHRCGELGSGADPLLDTLKDNGGYTQTHALLAGSPAIDAGDPTVCADPATVNNQDQRSVTRPFDGDINGTSICDIGAFEVNTGKRILRSQATYDGWVLESDEFSGKGGSKNNRGKVLMLGDDAQDKQYRAILSFNTAILPDNAKITRVILKVRKAGVVGTNPMKTHNGLYVDVKKNKFYTRPILQLQDFQARPTRAKVGKFPNKLYSGWYRSVLYASGRNNINKTGLTQFRLRFLKDDNNDNGADILKLYSGNAALSSRPILIVEYYVE